MKELTREKKAKRYDEVLKQIKECTPDENGFITIYPQEIFPEFKESENEKIRKAIVKYVSALEWRKIYGVTRDDMLAWLEKQGEQKPEWSEEDNSILNGIIAYLSCNACDLEGFDKWYDWLKSLRPKKQERLEIEVLKCKNDQWVLKVNGNIVRGQLSDGAETIYKNFVYCSEIHPQSHWKPTKEQIEALECYVEEIEKTSIFGSKLVDLLEQLKTL